jgi:hypothetical protein
MGGHQHVGRSPASSGERYPAISRRLALSTGVAAVTGWLMPRFGLAASSSEADSTPATRDAAINSLPLTELTAESRRKVMSVCERPTIFRRLPHESMACDPALYLFLIRNPEVVVNIWQLMGVASMTAHRLGPFLWKGNDGAGTTCDVELIYGTTDTHIIYSDGYYEGTLLKKKVMGRCVLVLRSGYMQAADRRSQVASRLDLFLQIDNLAADAVARTLSPWVGKVADANFHESCRFAATLSQHAENNQPGVQRLAEKLTKVEPPVREQFVQVTAAVHQRAASRGATTGLERR